MSIADPEMTAGDVIEIVKLFNQNGIEVSVDGGWGVDALLGRQTRTHTDLDIAVEHKAVTLIRALLEARGYRDVPRDDTRDCNFVLGDDQGHLIDIHTYTFDSDGNLLFGVAYPYDSLKGMGVIAGLPVKCITPEWMVKFHSGYALDENDYQDVKALCQHFAIPIPADYAAFQQKETLTRRGADVDKFFEGYAGSRQLFDALLQRIDEICPVEIKVTKSQIAFRRNRPFTWVWIPAQYLRGNVAPLVLSLALPSRDPSPRWKEIVEPARGRFMHHLELYSTSEIDDEVDQWIQQAWKFAG